MIPSLEVAGPSRLHDLAPEVKVVATLAVVLGAVATPARAWPVLLGFAVVVAGLGAAGGVPARLVIPRLAIEAPFVAFAAAIPFVAAGPRVQLGPLALSEPGLWATWGIVAKGAIGLGASLVLVATTGVVGVLRGLDRLGVPRTATAIARTMLRYLELVGADLGRLQVARVSRGDDPRWIGQARVLARTTGVLLVRSYERGERVHLAMAARGYTGQMPVLDDGPSMAARWAPAVAVGALAAGLATIGHLGPW